MRKTIKLIKCEQSGREKLHYILLAVALAPVIVSLIMQIGKKYF